MKRTRLIKPLREHTTNDLMDMFRAQRRRMEQWMVKPNLRGLTKAKAEQRKLNELREELEKRHGRHYVRKDKGANKPRSETQSGKHS